MNTQKIIIAIVVMYFMHLVVANWVVIKQVITGTYQSGFIFFDFKLLTMCFLAFLSVLIVQFTNKEKKVKAE